MHGIDTVEQAVQEDLAQPIRVALCGSTVSPPLFESIEILGKEESLVRISVARALMGSDGSHNLNS